MEAQSGKKDGKYPHAGHRQRLRARLAQEGLDSFSDREVLELLLFYAIPRRDTAGVARELMERFGTLERVFSASQEELAKVPGMGDGAAVFLRLVLQVFRRMKQSQIGGDIILDTTQRQGEFFLDLFLAECREVMYELCLDGKGKKLNLYPVGGQTGSVEADIRRIVENALWARASSVVLAHNHPSGLAFPSDEDVIATARVRDALSAVGIRLLDHIVVADHDYVSLRLSGML